MLLPSSERNRYPLAVSINKGLRFLDRKLLSEARIVWEERVDGRIVAGRHAPGSVFPNQVLLHHQLAVGAESLIDVREHDRVEGGELSGDSDATEFDPM